MGGKGPRELPARPAGFLDPLVEKPQATPSPLLVCSDKKKIVQHSPCENEEEKSPPPFLYLLSGTWVPSQTRTGTGAYSAQLVKGSRNPKPACPGTSFLNPNLSHCSLLEPGSLPWPWGPTATLLALQAVSSTLSSLELLRKQQGFVTCSNQMQEIYSQTVTYNVLSNQVIPK